MNNKLNCPECGVEIDEHDAGRCLDAWVAEKIMDDNPHWLGDGIEVNILSIGESGDEVLHYSTNIAAAWQVVEKMRDSGLCPTVYWDDGDDIPDCTGWQVCMAHYGNTEDEFRLYDGWASTAPLAICRAAIKAVSNAATN